MILFVILGLMTVAAMAALVAPLLRGYGAIAPRAEYDIEIYRDQLDELERDVERGVINAEEQTSARTEIQRRMLSTESGGQDSPAVDTGKSGMLAGFAIMMLLPLAAGSLYLDLGSPGVSEQPFAERPAAPAADTDMSDVETMVANLAERLEAEPDDMEGWLMLGRSYGVLGQYVAAVTAIERAWELDGSDPDILASLAEYRIFITDGMVNPAAMADFRKLLVIAPGHPAARFYLGLANVQSGKYRVALDEWVAFARESPSDAPWMNTLREQIASVSETLGVAVPSDLEGLPVTAMDPSAPGPSAEDIAAAQSMSADEQSTMIRSMVARLAARLEDEPGDIEGWRRLANAYGVLGETDLAMAAYAQAAAQAPDDLDTLYVIAEAIIQASPEDKPLPTQAVSLFTQILDLDSDSPVALWHLGLASAESGKNDDARDFWDRLLALIPADSNDRAAVQRAIDSL